MKMMNKGVSMVEAALVLPIVILSVAAVFFGGCSLLGKYVYGIPFKDKRICYGKWKNTG